MGFNYNSNHKIITALIFVGWTIFHFVSEKESKFQYNNGQVKRIGSTKESKNNGIWTWYYENGKKNIEGNFINGQREGKWITWDVNGNKIIECEYHHDKLNGTYILWNDKQEIIYQNTYKDDVPLK